jgi:hypothetical protein
MWMRQAPATTPSAGALPALAGGSSELDAQTPPPEEEAAAAGELAPQAPGAQPEVVLVAVLAGAATIFFGIVPQPLFNLVHDAGRALGLL